MQCNKTTKVRSRYRDLRRGHVVVIIFVGPGADGSDGQESLYNFGCGRGVNGMGREEMGCKQRALQYYWKYDAICTEE